MTVDFVASERHLWDHLAPVVAALPPGLLGTVHLPTHHVADLLGTVPNSSLLRPVRHTPVPLVGASWGDIGPHRKRRPTALMEHGAGATYPEPNPAFAGGTNREGVRLFLAPNEHVRQANFARYPDVPNVTVGTPFLDAWHDGTRPRPDPSEKVLVFSFHWDMRRWHGGRSALDHHIGGMRQAAEELRSEGWEVLGTCHPRAWVKPPNCAAAYDRANIEPVQDFGEVLDRATVLACDVSSSAWLSASAGCAQVLLDCPGYTSAYVDGVWPRFVLPLGPVAAHPDQIGGAVKDAHRSWHTDPVFAASVAEVVPYPDGKCAQRAAAAIVEHLG